MIRASLSGTTQHDHPRRPGSRRPPCARKRWKTLPSWGAMRSMRFSRSFGRDPASRPARISLPRISARSLPTSVRRSSSIWMILSWVSAMRPRGLRDRGDQRAAFAFEGGRPSRSSVVTRLNGTRFLLPQSAHNPPAPAGSSRSSLGLCLLLLEIALDLLGGA